MPLFAFGGISAAIKIMFGLSAVVLVLFIGMGVDYLTALSFKARWDTSADAAGQGAGLKAFKPNAGTSEQTEAVTPTVSMSVSRVVTATVTNTGTVASHFGPLVGIPSMSVSKSTATNSMPTYVNYYIIVDASQSMGVGATRTDMSNLYVRTNQYGPMNISLTTSARESLRAPTRP